MITRDGRPVAVLTPVGSEQRVRENLVRDGSLTPENAATARGLADWPLPSPEGGAALGSASAALLALREKNHRPVPAPAGPQAPGT
ncbi:hypothetical protein ABZW03_38775 [Kitasatospora sp. NPDC004799]|uniref:hypothetical protein n=1 Tax=Kitasatospora sp. NPDC004799 TaxID=3154460 RepID=UPI0033B8B7DE